MEPVYAELARRHRETGLDFAGVRTFNLDEYVGLSADDPHSYHFFMQQHLFQHVNIQPGNTHLPDGTADDIAAECQRYERAITECGGIDLMLVGIGRNGHIGFNEPLSAMFSRTRAKVLSPQTVEQNAPLFGGADGMPRRAITMGVGTILDARRCLLLATGEGKADIIAKAVEGPVTSMLTGSALQVHPHCTVIVDEAAAARLQHHEYYRWIFDNDPDWEGYGEDGPV